MCIICLQNNMRGKLQEIIKRNVATVLFNPCNTYASQIKHMICRPNVNPERKIGWKVQMSSH